MTNYIERYWRDAKPEDAIKEPPLVARFDGSVVIGRLRGFKAVGDLKWCNDESMWWSRCQVYDAPDPGEAYRLIDITKDKKQYGDEYLSQNGTWKKADKAPFCNLDTYRRRIAPTVTYVPFTWEDREQLRGRWVFRNKDGDTIEETAVKLDSRVFDAVATHLLDDGWRFIDTGEPVGKKVTQ